MEKQTTPEHPVKLWLAATGRKQSWLAKQIGIGENVLSNNLSGKTAPRKRTILAIQAVSENAVMASEWPTTEVAK